MIAAPAKRKYTHRKTRQIVGSVIHLGAGLQSSALAEMYITGDLEIPDLIAVIFADTGDEPRYVYEQVDYLRNRLACVHMPLVTIPPAPGIVEGTKSNKYRFTSLPLFVKNPDGTTSMIKRQCTTEYKIRPIRSWILQWLLDHGYAQIIQEKNGRTQRRPHRSAAINNIFGISLDEFQRTCNASKGPKWFKHDYPLIAPLKMRREDCQRWLEAHNLRVPKKSSCKRCPYHDDPYWLDMATHQPADFKEVCQFDDWLRTPEGKARLGTMKNDCYLHRSGLPLREVKFNLASKAPSFACVHCEV